MKEKFIERAFKADTMEIIDKANAIIREYRSQGFTLTLRQLYYQFVSRDIIPNKQTEYKRLGSIINDARLAGLVDWEAIEDRTRNLRTHTSWTSPESIMRAVAEQYRENPWLSQCWRPEVWIEKDALVGVVEPVCERWQVPYFACRGYASQSEVYSAGKRFQRYQRDGLKPLVLHLGDHDPSGIDMTRDNIDRLAMFARLGVPVRRLALNMDQIEEYDPPPNPAKETDSRAADYIETYGESSWELDALEPTVIDSLIDNHLRGIVDQTKWEEAISQSEIRRDLLNRVSVHWDSVVQFLEGEPDDE